MMRSSFAPQIWMDALAMADKGNPEPLFKLQASDQLTKASRMAAAAQLGFRDLTRQCCFWLRWPKDDHQTWEWLYRVVWADVHRDIGPLKELLFSSTARPVPPLAVPYVSDFLDRSILGKHEHGPKVPLWDCPTLLEACRRMVHQIIEEKKGITVKAAVDEVFRIKVEPSCFWPDLDRWWPYLERDYLYKYIGQTRYGRQQKQRMEALKNPPRFIVGPASNK